MTISTTTTVIESTAAYYATCAENNVVHAVYGLNLIIRAILDIHFFTQTNPISAHECRIQCCLAGPVCSLSSMTLHYPTLAVFAILRATILSAMISATRDDQWFGFNRLNRSAVWYSSTSATLIVGGGSRSPICNSFDPSKLRIFHTQSLLLIFRTRH